MVQMRVLWENPTCPRWNSRMDRHTGLSELDGTNGIQWDSGMEETCMAAFKGGEGDICPPRLFREFINIKYSIMLHALLHVRNYSTS